MKHIVAAIVVALLAVMPSMANDNIVRVACIGNSITYGLTLEDPATQSYPSRLQAMLGSGYEVGNFGLSGATLMRNGHRPYNLTAQYAGMIAFRPDIAVIHLGINDTDPRDWPHYSDRFAADYMALIDSLRAVNPDVRIIIANLTPINASHYRFRSGTRQWLRLIRDLIPQIAKAAGAELIDFSTPLLHRRNLIHDGIHPNAEGAMLLARSAYQAITGCYDGLSMPAIWGSGMVIQRDRFIPIEGTADAGSDIEVTIGTTRLHARAGTDGRWRVVAPPLTAGGPYTITVTDGTTTLRYADVMAGEVWIASGQSNMEFPLSDQIGAAEAVASSSDPLLRFYNMQAVARTYPGQWADTIIERTNRLQYFLPTRWEASSPATSPRMSAIAYQFARELRDSLQVPVGIIMNASGGAPIESWIDVTTLEDNMPEVLVKWLSNDYIQPWAQNRAKENLGPDHLNSLHPYAPGYLFASAIAPLGTLPIAGTIWYQGESNAHNYTTHASLFPLLLESWRNHFGQPDMPVIFAQLSSLNRDSWPRFRDSQRLLETADPATFMVVTSDRGDSLDVHPRDKQPIGHRMALRALRRVYPGRPTLTDHGPMPVSVRPTGDGHSLIITFDTPTPLTTSDSLAPITFELASHPDLYSPAQATIISPTEIKVTNMNISKPRFVRYGWQPFTRANLINTDSLPASTFAIEATDATDIIEAGIEAGISAPFAAMAGGHIIMAGGCNFPVDPMGPASQKKFYQGIYAANPTDMAWQRIGTLPAPNAYGATATTPLGIILIGGTPDGTPSPAVSLMTVDSTLNVTIAPLPAMPVTIDNMAAAAIGNKVYVAGGNTDSRPSADLWMLDLDQPSPRWQKLRSMPGNPRVQPVMAAAPNALGEICLYLWGGFAGRHDKHEPTLELGGLCYTPSKNKWTVIAGPTDADGTPLSVGGGCCATLPDGRIAVAGGVNKDIFLDALRNQAPDYLQHPIEWYRFNPDVIIYNPLTDAWTTILTDPMAARAGAAMVTDPANSTLYLIGGELKPRIRTAETLQINL